VFQISASGSGQPSSTFIGDIPTLAGNKPGGSLMLGAGEGRIDMAELDRLTSGTDGPFMPSGVKLFLNSSLQVQSPGMVEDLGWTALVWGVRGFPPSKGFVDLGVPFSPQRKDYRLDLKGHDEVQKAHSKVLAGNQSLCFVPTVCIVEYTGPGSGLGSGQGRQGQRNGENGAKKENFYTDFANWQDADFWCDIPSISGSDVSFLDGKKRLHSASLCSVSSL
jgi:hypothetical protein